MSISPKTQLTLTISGTVTLAGVLIGIGWHAANIMSEIKTEIAEIRREMRSSNHDRWTTGDMERWSYSLERSNRERSLIVPDVRGIKGQ